MKKGLLAGLAVGVMMFGMTGIANATSVAVNTTDWHMKSWQGGTSVITQESDGVKFTPGNIWRTNEQFINNTAHDFSNSSIYFKFMASGGGAFMDANVGLIFDDQPTVFQTESQIVGSHYTTGNPFYSYMINNSQWYYSKLTITPDQKYSFFLYANGFEGTSGSQLLDTNSGVIANNEWANIGNAKIFASIGDNRYPGYDQWYKLGEVSYDSAAPVPEPATILLFGTGIAGLVASRRRKKAF